ncbi:hypothetical protein SESBI_19156 [Sesbania bispinosa]|nr:hypothetical protein SESBI_19156 [Sesbania bispinosa]
MSLKNHALSFGLSFMVLWRVAPATGTLFDLERRNCQRKGLCSCRCCESAKRCRLNKAKGFIETNLLPSVCSAISEYIQRDLVFGKAPTVKLRLRPFASLSRGKLVIDAVLSHPSVLVVQKKDYTWLGIPFSEGGREKHFSTEEGIDHRTRNQETCARGRHCCGWERERDDGAREAAEVGYFVPERSCGVSQGDGLKEIETRSTELTENTPFFCINGGKHDHRFMDTDGKFGEPASPSECFHFMNNDMHAVEIEVDKNANSVTISDEIEVTTRESKFENLQSSEDVAEPTDANSSTEKNVGLVPHVADNHIEDDNLSGGQPGLTSEDLIL